MQTIIVLYVTTQIALGGVRDRLAREEGQTSMEWLGIAAVIVAIVVFLAGGPADAMGRTIRDAFQTLVGDVLAA